MTVGAIDTQRADSLRADLGESAVESWQVQLDLDALTAVHSGDGSRVKTARGLPHLGHAIEMNRPEVYS